jgi:hypothetical protein
MKKVLCVLHKMLGMKVRRVLQEILLREIIKAFHHSAVNDTTRASLQKAGESEGATLSVRQCR